MCVCVREIEKERERGDAVGVRGENFFDSFQKRKDENSEVERVPIHDANQKNGKTKNFCEFLKYFGRVFRFFIVPA